MAFLFKPFNSKNYRLCFTVKKANGKYTIRGITTGESDRDQAEEKLRLFNMIREGRMKKDVLRNLIAAAGGNVPEEISLRKLWQWYLEHCEVTGDERTQRDRLNCLNRFLEWIEKFHPEIDRVCEVSLRIASEYWQRLASNGCSPSTRNNNLSALNTIWSNVQAPMELPCNPWSAIKRDVHGSIPYQPFSRGEVEALRKAASEYKSLMSEPGFWSTAIEMGYYTGLRLGDIATLERDEIKIDDGYLILIPNKTRHWGGDRVAVHSLESPWVKMLPESEQSTGYVWPLAAKSYLGVRLSREFTEIAQIAGIDIDREATSDERRQKKVRLKCFHSLRHTFATEMLKAGMTENELRDQGNWSGTEVIHGHYNHAKLELAKKAAAKVAMLQKGKDEK